MKTNSISILLLLGFTSTISARQRTNVEKTAIALQILGGNNGTRSSVNPSSPLRTLAFTKGYTVIGRAEGGFAIVSNDDANEAVVGYSTTATFDASQPALAWYLDAANDVLLSSSFRTVKRTAIPDDCKTNVPALMKSQWSQDDPYWYMCPKEKSGKKCYTGCVATAMAQVMYYYKYPDTGMGGSASVKCDGMEYTVNFASSKYDWASMLDTYVYGGSYSVMQKQAIGRIMYDCGVAVSMNYSSTFSGANLKNVPAAMTDHFGYIAQYYGYKENYYENYKYDFDKWNQTVYRELSAGHPIIYAGLSVKQGNNNQSNHAFIIDGYDNNGYVHVNWGYGGLGDGTFDINLLQLKIEGSYDEEYKWYQQMVVVHHPDAGEIKYDLDRIYTSIESVETDGTDATNAPVRVYDTAGRLLQTSTKSTFNPSEIKKSGVVVVREGSKSRKMIVR